LLKKNKKCSVSPKMKLMSNRVAGFGDNTFSLDLKILTPISRANDSNRPKPNFGSCFDEKNEF